jgi:hypothetical protein
MVGILCMKLHKNGWFPSTFNYQKELVGLMSIPFSNESLGLLAAQKFVL